MKADLRYCIHCLKKLEGDWAGKACPHCGLGTRVTFSASERLDHGLKQIDAGMARLEEFRRQIDDTLAQAEDLKLKICDDHTKAIGMVDKLIAYTKKCQANNHSSIEQSKAARERLLEAKERVG